MPYPSQTTAGLWTRFGESPCYTQERLKCLVSKGCGRCCNRCVEPNSKRLCLLSGRRVNCGCDCKSKCKRSCGGRRY